MKLSLPLLIITSLIIVSCSPLPATVQTPVAQTQSLTLTTVDDVPIEIATQPRRIVFVSDRDGNEEIYTMNFDGSNQTRITDNPFFDGGPAWSRDGKGIIFHTDRDGNFDIYTMDDKGKDLVNLTNNPFDDTYPDWAPDMQKVVFESFRDGNYEIYVMDANGDNQTRLTNNPDVDRIPRWSPDGRYIAFTSIRNGNMDIYIMNPDGSNQINLTSDLSEDCSPVWSPDGDKIAFDTLRDGEWQLYMMNTDGTDQTRITYDIPYYGFPDWSPDGEKIAFLYDNGQDFDIQVMDAEGRSVISLVNSPANDYDPRWSPGTSTVKLSDLTDPEEILSFTAIPSAATSLPTAILVPSSPTAATLSSMGGVIIGTGTTQLVLYGMRTGTSIETIHIVDTNTLDDVKTQSGVQIALSGSGPQLFAYFPDQQFNSSGGETALADMSIGSTDNPNTSIGFLWTSDIDGIFPAAKAGGAQMDLFSVLSGQPVELEGWLQFGKVWLADNSGTVGMSQENLDFFLFHHNEEVYVLGFLPDYQSTLPAEDLSGSPPAARSGEDNSYVIKGFLGGTVSIPLGGMFPIPVPILQVTSIERKE